MAVGNSLANRQQKTGLTAYLTNDAVKNQINNVVGGKNGDRFIASIVSAVQVNSDLQECTNPSRNNKKGCKEAQFQLGYKGYIQLAIRSGQYKKLNVLAIKDGELVRFDPLNEEIEVNLIDDEEVREEAKTIGYYAMFEYTNGFRKAMYWSKKKMEAHALKYSKGYAAKKGYTFWEKDFDGMAYKTMLRQLISKWGIMSIDMQNAMESDMAVIHEDGTKDYVDTVSEENIVADQDLQEAVEETTEPEKQEPQEETTKEEPQQFFK